MKRLFSLSIAISALAITSCSKTTIRGEGSTVSETRQLQEFAKIEANGSTDIEILPASTNSVVLTGYGNLIPAYDTRISGDRLILEFKDEYINVRNNNLKITVYTNGITDASLNGSGNMYFAADIPTEQMDADINGSGKISFDRNVFVNASYKINGSGEIDARKAEADHAHATISGSGDIDLTATKSLNNKISGSGTIDYWGNPGSITTDIDGSGKVRKN
jgi:hypothetical protein